MENKHRSSFFKNGHCRKVNELTNFPQYISSINTGVKYPPLLKLQKNLIKNKEAKEKQSKNQTNKQTKNKQTNKKEKKNGE